ncbi:DNA double-strand break repair rad50 ATPase, putative [Ixodes scapularis]|uniref:DNA double-strand break repair rad50 ATPase, putative n=1 Tax=Ixodes scapularis TaxID=6945 RepID=B7PV52_IXOSC|nr:DNA double-strand break repair rad50 ATPase, putative [Ixodes scapularis]|eukprot:XP_002407401.1 DNA double-strand break repair rad50 ATPase, putative [Ixodes scapularis]
MSHITLGLQLGKHVTKNDEASILHCGVVPGHGSAREGVTGFDFDQANLITIKPFQDAPSDNDTQVTVIDTLRDISKTLKKKFIILGDKIKEKMNQLKQAAGDQAQKIKSQLNDLKQQLKDSVQALRKKVQGFFDKGQYASFGEEAIKVFGKLFNIRARLNEFIKGMKDITGDKLRQMQELAKQLRQEIKIKVQELLHGSSNPQAAVYYVMDDDDVEDSEAYVIATLKDISKSLKEKFLLIVEHLREKFAELKKAGGEHAEKIKGELQALMEQMAEAREAMKQKVQELFKPAQYASFGEHAMEIFAKLVNLREKLNKFLKDVKKVTGEKVDKLRELIKETREEIKKRIQELMGSSSGASAQYQAIDADEDKKAYIVDTLKDISKTLKEKLLVLGIKIAQKIQDLKEAVGLRATVLKKQLQELKGQLGEAAGTMKKKVLEIVRPAQSAQYGLSDDMFSEVSQNLAALRKKLQSFLEKVQKLAGEKWVKMQETIRELRNEIKQSIRKLLHGKIEVQSTLAPEPMTAMPIQY